MEKQAPAPGRILVAVAFAVSCFVILLYLWVSFGGPTPLGAQSYRITADFDEAITLAEQSDVRIGGVTIGKVVELELAPGEDATRATMEIEPAYAPISDDAQAILRLKTLLGETYIELTAGSRPESGPVTVALGPAVEISEELAAQVQPIPEDGHIAGSQVREAVQIDEIFNALDAKSRRTFQGFQRSAAGALAGRGLDLSDSLGNLAPFLGDAAEIVRVLRGQRPAVRGLIRDTGTLFEALTERDRELATLITGSNDLFGAVADSDQALTESIQIFPAFEQEARLTFERLDGFRENAHPLVRELLPVARDVSPTLRSVGRLSPDLESLFEDLDVLADAGEQGLPALRSTVNELRPVVDALEPALAELNPIVSLLASYRRTVTDFIAGPPQGIAAALESIPGQDAPRHTVRQLAYVSAESLSMYGTRLDTNRGNGYVGPETIGSPRPAASGTALFDFDCKNTDYTPGNTDPDEDEVTTRPPVGVAFAPCLIQGPFEALGYEGRFPNVVAEP